MDSLTTQTRPDMSSDWKEIPHRRFYRPTDLAWAAGFVDGEGCITITRQKSPHSKRKITYKCELIVVNTHKDSISRLKALLGGRYYMRKRKSPWNTLYELKFSNADAIKTVRVLLPFLTTKYYQAKILCEWTDEALWCHQGGNKTIPDDEFERRVILFRRLRLLNGGARKSKCNPI